MVHNEQEFKQAAKLLKKEVENLGIESFSHGAALNMLSRALGQKDYNTIKPVIKEYESSITKTLEAINHIEAKADKIENILVEEKIKEAAQKLYKIVQHRKKATDMSDPIFIASENAQYNVMKTFNLDEQIMEGRGGIDEFFIEDDYDTEEKLIEFIKDIINESDLCKKIKNP